MAGLFEEHGSLGVGEDGSYLIAEPFHSSSSSSSILTMSFQFSRAFLHPLQQANHVPAYHHPHLVLAHPSFQKLRHEVRVARDIVEVPGPVQHAVEIGSDAHMPKPDPGAGVDDVVGHVRQGGGFCWRRRRSGLGRSWAKWRRRDEVGEKTDHDDPAVLSEEVED